MFHESARLSFARACERVARDVSVDHPDAWVVDDRRVSFAIESEMSSADVQHHQRFLEELAGEARGGEAYLAPEGHERWAILVGHTQSGVPDGRTSESTQREPSDTDVTAVRFGRQ